jgi:hypothetical protein
VLGRKRPLLLIACLAACATQAEDAAGPPSWDREERPLRAVTEPPHYLILPSYDSIWVERVRAGIDEARAYFGEFGPVRVYVLGVEGGDVVDPSEREAFIEAFCACRHAETRAEIPDCRKHEGARLFEVAESGEAEAYLSMVDYTEPPIAELVFINVQNWFVPEDPVPDPTLRGIHEYTHVYQSAFGPTPTWMMEGAAMFFEVYLPWRRGARDPYGVMAGCMEKAQRMTQLGLSIECMEEIETAPEGVRDHHRELAYDAGAWAVAFLIHQSRSRSVSSLRDDFYPSVDELGWEAAIARYVGVESVSDFYAAFESFLELPLEEQLTLLDRLEE